MQTLLPLDINSHLLNSRLLNLFNSWDSSHPRAYFSHLLNNNSKNSNSHHHHATNRTSSRSLIEVASLPDRKRRRGLSGKTLLLLWSSLLLSNLNLSKIRSLAIERSSNRKRRRIGTTSRTHCERVHTMAQVVEQALEELGTLAKEESKWLILPNSSLSMRRLTVLLRRRKNFWTDIFNIWKKPRSYSPKKESWSLTFRESELKSTISMNTLDVWSVS